MRQTFFADTSFLVAFYNSRDDRHLQARDFIADLSRRKASASFIITDYIFDETLTTILKSWRKTIGHRGRRKNIFIFFHIHNDR